MLSIKKQIFNSVLVSASTTAELAETFMRYQEYYENPFWQGKIFTIGQLKEWYSKRYGGDTYKKDWQGFNIPSEVLIPFKKGLFDPLTNKEKELLNFFKYRNDNFYIIGAISDDVLNHELCHALYYTNSYYKKEINSFLSKYKKDLFHIERHLVKKGYSKKVLFDEIQAYALDDDGYLEENKIFLLKSIKDGINKIYKKYSKASK